MRLGEAITETAELIRENPVPSTPLVVPNGFHGCCFKLTVLAETEITAGETGELRNDKSDAHWFYSSAFTGATMKLQQNIDGVWTDVKDLDNNDFGIYSAFGYFTNDFDQKGMGYLLDWHKILVHIDLGEGSYRVKTVETNLFGEQNQYSFEYCLQTWTAYREEGTLKLEWNMNGKVGDPKDDRKRRDFGIQNRYNQIRLEGDFGRPSAPFERDYVHYQSDPPGKGRMVMITDKFKDEFLASIYPIPQYIHEFLKHDFMLADDRRISDFNTRNPVHYIRKYVMPISNWEPAWYFGVKEASVELKFEQLFQNNSHKRC